MVFPTRSSRTQEVLKDRAFRPLDFYFPSLRKFAHTVLLPRYLWSLGAIYRLLARESGLRENDRYWCFAIYSAAVTYMSNC